MRISFSSPDFTPLLLLLVVVSVIPRAARACPSVDSVTPDTLLLANASSAPLTTLRLRGAGFLSSAPSAVFVGGERCDEVRALSDTALECDVGLSGVAAANAYLEVAVQATGCAAAGDSIAAFPLLLYVASDCVGGNEYLDIPGQACLPCPAAAAPCPGGPRVLSPPGKWNDLPAGGPGITTCFPEDRCAGGERVCAEGYRGSFCGLCADSFFLDGQLCSSCDVGAAEGLVFFTEVFFLGAYVSAVVLSSDPTLQHVIGALNSLQAIQLVGDRLSTELPSAVRGTFQYLSLVNLKLSFIDQFIACGRMGAVPANSRFSFQYYGNLVIVVGLTVGLLPLTALSERLWYRGRVVRGLTVNAMMGYLVTTTNSLLVLSCVEVDGVWYQRNEMGTRCYRGSHAADTTVAVLALACFSLAYPVWLFYHLWFNEYRLHEHQWRERFGAVYAVYFERNRYYGSWFYFSSCSLALGSSLFVQNLLVKFFLRFCVVFTMTVLVIVQRPFRLWWKNITAAAGSAVAAFGSITDLLEYLEVSLTGNTGAVLAYMFVGLTGVVVLLYGVAFFVIFVRFLLTSRLCDMCALITTGDEVVDDATGLRVGRKQAIEMPDSREAANTEAVLLKRAAQEQDAGALVASSSGDTLAGGGGGGGGADGDEGGVVLAIRPTPANLAQIGNSTRGASVYRDRSSSTAAAQRRASMNSRPVSGALDGQDDEPASPVRRASASSSPRRHRRSRSASAAAPARDDSPPPPLPPFEEAAAAAAATKTTTASNSAAPPKKRPKRRSSGGGARRK